MVKRKGIKKDNSAKNESKTAATSTINTKEVKTVITKAEKVHLVTKLPGNNQGLKFSEDIKVGEESSHSQESFMTDEKIYELLNRIEKFVISYVNTFCIVPPASGRPKVRTYSILDPMPHLSKYVKGNFREFFKNPLSILNEKNVDRLWNIFYLYNEVPEFVRSSKKDYVIKTLEVVMSAEDPKKSSSVDDTQKPTCLPQESPKQKEYNCEDDGFNGDIQENPQSPYKTVLECHEETASKNPDGVKGKAKDGQEIRYKDEKANLHSGHAKSREISIQGVLRNSNKYTDLMHSGSDTVSEMNRKFQPHLNIIKGTKDTYFEEKGIKGDPEAVEDIKASKAEADKTNDLIIQLQKVEKLEKGKDDVALSKKEAELLNDTTILLQKLINKIDAEELEDVEAQKENDKLKNLLMQLQQIQEYKKQNGAKELEDEETLNRIRGKLDYVDMKLEKIEQRKENVFVSFTDSRKAAGKFPLTTMEDKNKKEKCKEDVERYSESIQDSRFNNGIISQKQELEYDTRKNDVDKTIYTEKTKILPTGDFNFHRGGIKSQLKCGLDKKRSLFFLGTEPITGAAKTESHVKTKDTTDLNSCCKTEPIAAAAKTESRVKTEDTTDIKYDLQKIVSPAASFEPKEEILDLKQIEDIHFVFDTGNTMKILVGDKDYQLKDNEDITFNYKEENVTISFTGKQISVLTPSSEFDISIRKFDRADSTDKATETYDLM